MKTHSTRSIAALAVLTAMICPADDGQISLLQKPVFFYPEISSTNIVFPQAFEFRFIEEAELKTEFVDLPVEIILPVDEESPEVEKNETDLSSWDSAVVLSNITENGILCWQLGLITATNQTATTEATKIKLPQILEFGNLISSRTEQSNNESFSDIKILITRPQPAWNEWLSPSRVLAGWTELWTTETSEGTVILLSISR